jgi:hypothetical protein
MERACKTGIKDAIIATMRETSNFFKHADKDHDAALHVVDVASLNILQLGICIVNYYSLFAHLTDHNDAPEIGDSVGEVRCAFRYRACDSRFSPKFPYPPISDRSPESRRSWTNDWSN